MTRVLACARCGTRFFRLLDTTCHRCGAATNGCAMMSEPEREAVEISYGQSKEPRKLIDIFSPKKEAK